MDIRPKHHRFDLSDIPAGNVLDLRSAAKVQPVPARREKALKEFWAKPAPKQPRLRRVRAPRPVKRPLSHRVRGQIGSLQMRTRALGLRLRIGSFPIVAAALLVVISAVVGVASVLGLQSRVVAIARTGVESLRVAGAKASSSDLTGASASFTEAAGFFSQAEKEFDSLNPTLTAIAERVPFAGSKLSSAKHIVAAAQAASSAAATSTAIAQPLIDSGEGFAGPAGLIQRLEEDQATVDQVLEYINTALDHLEQVKASSLPDEYATYVSTLQAALPTLKQSLTSVDGAISVLSDLLGTGQPREHLFVFQNSNELRPTGGFIGSFALIRMDKGEFHILDAPDKGSLGVDEYLPDTITPPLPLQVITPSWYFRDANWYPDFPTSAIQLSRFYEQARGFAPRGVIGVTNGFLERMLAVTGPVELPQYGVTVNADNVTATAQEQVERKYDLRTNDPKRFVADLIPVIATKLSSLELGNYPRFLAAVAESVSTRDLQFWSSDATLQSTLLGLGWSGRLSVPPADSLLLVDTNIGGGKTDGVIREHVAQRYTFGTDGQVTVHVDVTREHTGTLGDSFTGSRNRTYHRLYVPLGSKFISASGFDPISVSTYRTLPEGSTPDQFFQSVEGRVTVDEKSGTRINDEFGRTVFGNWTEIDPGQTQTFSLTYALPQRFSASLARYDLMIGHQAGTDNRTYTLQVVSPRGRQPTWVSDATAEMNQDGFTLQRVLERDFSLSFIFKAPK